MRLLARKFHGSSPHSSHSANTFSPLGSPASGFALRKNPKTTEKIAMVASGFTSDQVQPSAERLYLPRSSRSVRLASSSRVETSSASAVTALV